jgi:hypothetical protein
LDIEPPGSKFLERWNGKLRGTAKHQLHSHSPSRMSFLILRLIKSRFSPLT